MGSSLDLGSLLSAIGSSSGINVSAAVAQALAAESGPLTQWQQQQASLRSQTGDINVVEGHISALQDALNSLNDPSGGLMAMTASSSNSAIVSATAAPGASPANHVVVVNSLAITGSWYSDPVANGDTTLAPGGFTFQVGQNSPIQVTIGDGVDTLNQVASYINGLNAGVTANVVNDATGSRLAIMSNSSGSANDVAISNASGLNFTRAALGGDASLTVDGIPVDSASNTVTGVVPGVTFNLVAAAPNSPVNISTTQDVGQVSQTVKGFVSAYNAVIQDVNQEFAVGQNGVQGPLAGDSTMRMLQDMLLSSANFPGGGDISSLASLGVSMNDDGTLKVDDATLSNAIQSDFSGVRTFFQGTSSNGYAATLNNQLKTMTDAVTGAFTVDLQSMNNEISDLQNHINDFQTYLQGEQARLTDEFNKAAEALQQLPILEQQINAELGGIGGNGNNNKG